MEYYEEEQSFKEKTGQIADKYRDTIIATGLVALGMFFGFASGKRKGAKMAAKDFEGACDLAYNVGIADGKNMALENIISNAITTKNN